MLFIWRQFIPWLPEFLPYTCTVCYLIIVNFVCYLIIVQGGSKSFRKDNERLARNEAFCGVGQGKNGVCKRQVTLYLKFYGSES